MEINWESDWCAMRKTDDSSPIIFYYYFDLADTEAFCELLRRRFVESGHVREIKFRSWDCYDDPPGRDGDVYCYDALVLSTLADEGYIRVLPDIIDTSRVFPWILDRSRIRNKIYGIPMMTCANVLISRTEDHVSARSIYELPEGLAAPMKSMAMTYYLYALCNLQDRKADVIKTLRQIQRIIGEKAYATSRFSVYDGVERFKRGECRYLIGFTEDIRNLESGDYTVSLVNISDQPVNEMPLLPTDFISLGTNIDTEKMLDCLDLMEIMADSDFVYDLCTTGGKLQYMLPADMSVYPRLEQLDPIYSQFYQIASNEDNGILRFGKHFYTDYLQKEEELLNILEAELGCDCEELRTVRRPAPAADEKSMPAQDQEEK